MDPLLVTMARLQELTWLPAPGAGGHPSPWRHGPCARVPGPRGPRHHHLTSHWHWSRCSTLGSAPTTDQ